MLATYSYILHLTTGRLSTPSEGSCRNLSMSRRRAAETGRSQRRLHSVAAFSTLWAWGPSSSRWVGHKELGFHVGHWIAPPLSQRLPAIADRNGSSVKLFARHYSDVWHPWASPGGAH